MSHKYEALLCAVLFTFWCVRIYYKLYAKKERKYILAIGILMVLWMLIRISMGTVYQITVERYLWYSYYIPLIFIPTIFYNYCYSLGDNPSRKRKVFTYSISTCLFLLVFTNDFHELIFDFNNGVNNYKDYTHNFGYFLVTGWIFFLLVSSIVRMIINRLKIKKDNKVIIPVIILLIGIIYTLLYIHNFGFTRELNMAVVYCGLIWLGIETIFYLNLIPNNKKYVKTFENSKLDMALISLDGEYQVYTKSLKEIPKSILNDLSNNTLKDIYNIKDITYEVKNNSNNIVIIRKDLGEMEELKKEIDLKKELLLKQYDSFKLEEKTKKELYNLELRNNVISKIEKKLNEKIIVAKDILNKDDLTSEDLENIKRIIIYCKKKSQLMISEINNEMFDEDNIKVLLDDLIRSMSNLANNSLVIVKNKMLISGYSISIIYDIIYEVIDKVKDKSLVIYVSLVNNKIELKIVIESILKLKGILNIDDKIEVNETHYDNDTILVFRSKEGV